MSRPVLQVLRDAETRTRTQGLLCWKQQAHDEADAIAQARATVERMAEALDNLIANTAGLDIVFESRHRAKQALRAYRGEQA